MVGRKITNLCNEMMTTLEQRRMKMMEVAGEEKKEERCPKSIFVTI